MDAKTSWHNLTVSVTLTDWLLMLFTFALTVLGGIQACEMHRQGNDTHTLAAQAVAQTKVAAETFSLAYRPNLEAQKAVLIQEPGGAMVYVTVVNSGTQSARDVSATAHEIFMAGDGSKGEASLKAETDFPPGRTTVLQLPVFAALIAPIFDGRETLVVEGEVSFREIRPADDPRGTAPMERSCFRFVYDPSARVFSPNLGC